MPVNLMLVYYRILKKELTVVMYICIFIKRNFTPERQLFNLKFTKVNGTLCIVTHASW